MFAIVSLFIVTNTFAATPCKPARETVEYLHSGQYHRVHPSGNYFLYTNDAGVTLVDITDRQHPKAIKTPMTRETYPVESAAGGWDLLASPRGSGEIGPEGGMDFYLFSDMISGNAQSARPVYTDTKFGEFYHSTAELPGSTSDTKKVRMLLYSSRPYKDYEMKMNQDGKVARVQEIRSGKLCENLFKRRQLSKQEKQAVDKQWREIEALKKEQEQLKKSGKTKEAEKLSAIVEEKNAKADADFFGPEYAAAQKKLPAISAELERATKEYDQLPEVVAARRKSEELMKEYAKKFEALFDSSAAIIKVNAELSAIEAKRKRPGADKRALEAQEDEVRTRRHKLEDEIERHPDVVKISKKRAEHAKTRSEFNKTNAVARRVTELTEQQTDLSIQIKIAKEGEQFPQPVLSKDGTYVAGLAMGRLQVFKIEANGDCTRIPNSMAYRGSKVSFSYPEPGKKPQITFTVEAGAFGDFDRKVIVYDLEKDKEVFVSDSLEDTEPYYPGFTKDGRVMFKTKSGMTIVDPAQPRNGNVVCHPGVPESVRPPGTGSK